ncbi:MAG: allantoinase AllB [Ferruginibacter sp.]|nr:allantoinase AllB [Ferruginibacter sp.]
MLVLHSKRVALPAGIGEAYVLIENGIIQSIQDNFPEGAGVEMIDVGNDIIMPGVIDPHVHVNEPGRTDWEGFETATRAAAAGGVTTIVDMPLNASPVTTNVTALAEKIASAEHQLNVNVGFWGGVVPGNEQEIGRLIAAGVLGFKAFLTHSGIDDFPNVTEADLVQVMPLIAKANLPLLVHCELTDTEQRSSGNVNNYQNYLNTRPKKWENSAIALMIRLAEMFDCKVHIVHLSSADSIEQIQRAKEKGLPVTVETGQHYLYFNAEQIQDGQTQFKCAPPIRDKENNDQLWLALKSGIIDFVATDHSPATPELKELESGNFLKAWGGIASLQFALPALWTAARQRGCDFDQVVKWLCENPAKLIGKDKTKGKIAAGYDADLVILDEKATFTVTGNMIEHRHKITPYLNEQLYGVVKQTYIAGTKVFDAGNFHPRRGAFVFSSL